MRPATRLAVFTATGSIAVFAGSFAVTRSGEQAVLPAATLTTQPAPARPQISGYAAVKLLPAMRRPRRRATPTPPPAYTTPAPQPAPETTAVPQRTVVPQQPKPKPIPKP